MPQPKVPKTLKFESVAHDLRMAQIHRAAVPGGWLIYVCLENSDAEASYAHGGLTFYPDPIHEWDGGSLT